MLAGCTDGCGAVAPAMTSWYYQCLPLAAAAAAAADGDESCQVPGG